MSLVVTFFILAALALPSGLQAVGLRPVRAPVVAGSPEVGTTLTAVVSMKAAKGTTYAFQWQTQKTRTIKKKTVRKWVAIPGQARSAYAPAPALKGANIRACVRARTKGKASPWKCSRPRRVIAALAAPTPAGASPSAAVPAAPDPLGVSFTTQRFVTGSAASQLFPTTSGGSGTPHFSSAGTLPSGVSFDQGTGAFTGPVASAWNFRAIQIAAGSFHTCALTTTGNVKCWGGGGRGQLGNGATTTQTTPVDVHTSAASAAPLTGITQITAAGAHTCALTTTGGVKCWGRGQSLGDGDGSQKSTPVDVVATGETQNGTPLTGITQITAGGSAEYSHTCALTTTGNVKCWGSGQNGQLGNGATTYTQSSPVNVHTSAASSAPLTGITQIAAGGANVGSLEYSHTCAVTTTGAVKCWGSGSDGQLGDGAAAQKTTPVDVCVAAATPGTCDTTLTGITQITAGGRHTCAITTTSTVKCWGYGTYGQLGDGTTTAQQTTPVDVHTSATSATPLSGITQITAGNTSTCALTTTGGVKCWGNGGVGQLGNGTTTGTQATPVDVCAVVSSTPGICTTALANVTQITAALSHICAVTTTGTAKCWGSGSSGQLGNGATTTQTTPVDVSSSGPQAGFPAPVTVTATDDTGSASTSFNLSEVSKPWFSYPSTLFTMGQDAEQLPPPVVLGGSGTRHFSYSGTLPTGVSFDQDTGAFTGPVASAWNFKATQIAAGSFHTCALTTRGAVKCWGSEGFGQLGNGTTAGVKTTPVDVCVTATTPGTCDTTLIGITQITAGDYYTCALTTTGAVKCWGENGSFQLGIGTTTTQTTPVDVCVTATTPGTCDTTLTGITQIAAGGAHTCALTTTGAVKCWGADGRGQVGNGNTLSGITQITAGREYTCALTTAGAVKCWGDGQYGQLGNGTTAITQTTPVDVCAVVSSTPGICTTALANITQITAGDYHPCALTTTGAVKCWGNGGFGDLGNGTSGGTQTTPVDVCVTATTPGTCDTTLTGITQITAGGGYTCSLTTTGAVKCWGSGFPQGQLGNGTASAYTTPVDVCVTATTPGTCDTTLTGITQIAAGGAHTCALTTTGAVKCWGSGGEGELGNGATTVAETTPVDVTKSYEQPGFPAELTVTVTDDVGAWTLGRLVLLTK